MKAPTAKVETAKTPILIQTKPIQPLVESNLAKLAVQLPNTPLPKIARPMHRRRVSASQIVSFEDIASPIDFVLLNNLTLQGFSTSKMQMPKLEQSVLTSPYPAAINLPKRDSSNDWIAAHRVRRPRSRMILQRNASAALTRGARCVDSALRFLPPFSSLGAHLSVPSRRPKQQTSKECRSRFTIVGNRPKECTLKYRRAMSVAPLRPIALGGGTTSRAQRSPVSARRTSVPWEKTLVSASQETSQSKIACCPGAFIASDHSGIAFPIGGLVGRQFVSSTEGA